MTDAPRARYRDALQSRDFRLMLAAFVVDSLGSWAYGVVISLDIYDRTHSATWLAAVASVRCITALIVSPWGGLIADKYERTRVMRTSALLSAATMFGIAADVATKAPVWSVLVLVAVGAVVASPYTPAAGAVTPEVVEEKDLAAANSLFALLDNMTVIAGPLLGGLLITIGATAGILVNAVSYIGAALIVSAMRMRARGSASEAGSLIAQWTEGLQALVSQRATVLLVAFCALDSAIYGASTVIFAPLSLHLGTGLSGYSYLIAGNAVGALIAAGFANRLSASPRLSFVISISLLLQAVPFALTAATHSAAVAVALQAVSGAGMIVVDVLALSALQRDVDRGVLSRVLGIFDACVIAASVVASIGFAALFEAAGLEWTLIAIGTVFPALALLGLPPLLRVEREAADATRRTTEMADVLAGLDIFRDSPRTVLEQLAMSAEARSVSAGTTIIRQGDTADALWILVRGSFATRIRGDDGVEHELPAIDAPAYVGELGLLHGVPRTATVTTTTDSDLFRISGPDFLQALESAPASSAFSYLTGVRMQRTPVRPAAMRQDDAGPSTSTSVSTSPGGHS